MRLRSAASAYRCRPASRCGSAALGRRSARSKVVKKVVETQPGTRTRGRPKGSKNKNGKIRVQKSDNAVVTPSTAITEKAPAPRLHGRSKRSVTGTLAKKTNSTNSKKTTSSKTGRTSSPSRVQKSKENAASTKSIVTAKHAPRFSRMGAGMKCPRAILKSVPQGKARMSARLQQKKEEKPAPPPNAVSRNLRTRAAPKTPAPPPNAVSRKLRARPASQTKDLAVEKVVAGKSNATVEVKDSAAENEVTGESHVVEELVPLSLIAIAGTENPQVPEKSTDLAAEKVTADKPNAPPSSQNAPASVKEPRAAANIKDLAVEKVVTGDLNLPTKIASTQPMKRRDRAPPKSQDPVSEKVVSLKKKRKIDRTNDNSEATIQGLALDCIELEIPGTGTVHFMFDSGNVFDLPQQITLDSKELYRFNALVIVDNKLQKLYTDNLGSVFRQPISDESDSSCVWEFFAFFENLAVGVFTSGEIPWFDHSSELPTTVSVVTQTSEMDEDDSGLPRSPSPIEDAFMDETDYDNIQLEFSSFNLIDEYPPAIENNLEAMMRFEEPFFF